MPDWCLVTDIDGTLIGGAASTPRLRRAVLEERRALEARGGRLHWVIATGRHIGSAREVLVESGFELADFDALVTSVGAELYLAGEQTACSTYAAHLRSGRSLPDGKGGAVAHLIAGWRLSSARTVAAGDSGNDASMLDQGWSGIIVRNGWTRLEALRTRPNVYFASAKYAAGVLEGLRALGFLPRG